jgi:hypothetical protein
METEAISQPDITDLSSGPAKLAGIHHEPPPFPVATLFAPGRPVGR